MINYEAMEAVIFDLGNVLISFDHNIAAGKIVALSHKPLPEIYQLFFDSGLTGLFEEGKITPEKFFIKVKKMLGLKIRYGEFLPIWNGIFFLTDENRRVSEIASSLKGRYKLALLSNINVLHFKYLKENFKIFDPFDYVVTSFSLGLRKPDPLVYSKTMKLLGVDSAQQVFYTDDRRELIEKAREMGIKGFVFTSAEQLIRDLGKAGIDVKN